MTPTQLSPGIAAVCSTEQKLIEAIKYARQELSKHLVVFSIYNQNIREKHDLTHVAGSFLCFQLFKAAFKKLPQNSESKKLIRTKCRNYYVNSANVLNEINNFEYNYKPNEVFQWYTNDSFVYRLINKALRTENLTSLCHFHFYIVDLSEKLEKDFNKIKKQNSKGIIQFYRGFITTKEVITSFENNIGHLILTNEYLLITRQRQIAYDFATKENTPPNIENVLFGYSIYLTKVNSVVFADISQYNQFSKGNEILFDLGFETVPGGDSYAHLSVLSYHWYCTTLSIGLPISASSGATLLETGATCSLQGDLIFQVVASDIKYTGGLPFLTEFGFPPNTDAGAQQNNFVMDKYDQYFQSWTVWGMGFLDEFNKIQYDALKQFNRPYAYAIVGDPILMLYDRSNTRCFTLKYTIDLRVNCPSLIYLPSMIYPPNGYKITLSVGLTSNIYADDPNLIDINTTSSATNGTCAIIKICPT